MAERTEIDVQDAEKQELAEEGPERTRDRRAFVPRSDIYEDEDRIVIVADMPGVTEESIDITLEKNVLTINGYVEDVRPDEDYALAYAEYRVGDYVRRFSVSNQIDQENIEATVRDGVLRLNLPKVKPTTKKITVSAG
jgi:HSP20 family molecular chaperone IbpA